MTDMIFLTAAPFLALFVCEFAYHPQFLRMGGKKLLKNWAVWFLMELILYHLIPWKGIGLAIFFLTAILCGIGSYFVILFRSTPVTPADLLSLNTGVAVAGAYQFHVPANGILAILAGSAGAAASMILTVSGRLPEPRFPLCWTVAAALILVTADLLRIQAFRRLLGIRRRPWRQVQDCKDYGFLPFFLCALQDLKVAAPEGYTTSGAEAILDDAAGKTAEQTAGKAAVRVEEGSSSADADADRQGNRPAIIAIMNESFSDLSVLGPFECTKEHLKFYYSLKDDPGMLEYGWDHVSTRGGGTARTEFEFLTGHSMAFQPGSIPWIQYDFKNTPSIAADLKKQGYTAIAMHPELGSNWSRDKVFRALGFDSFLDIRDFPEARPMVFGHTDDQSDYERLIREFEAHPEPLFLFNITMQNHGGYALSAFEKEGKEIVSIDEKYREHTDAQAFESLMKASDDALAFLMDYFRKTERPVVLCFFGDHQPAMPAAFEQSLEESGKQPGESDVSVGEKYFRVPYFIWTNDPEILADREKFRAEARGSGTDAKDSGADAKASGTDAKDSGTDLTSPNFLGVAIQVYAGTALSDYSELVRRLRGCVPALNETGWLSTDGVWHGWEEADDAGLPEKAGDASLPEEAGDANLLLRYRMAQYYSLFDPKRRAGAAQQ